MSFDVDPGLRDLSDYDGPGRSFSSMKKNYGGLSGSSFPAETGNDDPVAGGGHKIIDEQPCARDMPATLGESANVDEFARSIDGQLYYDDRGRGDNGQSSASGFSGSSMPPEIMEYDDDGGSPFSDCVAAGTLVDHPDGKTNDDGYDEATRDMCIKGCVGNPPVDARRDELERDAPVKGNPLIYPTGVKTDYGSSKNVQPDRDGGHSVVGPMEGLVGEMYAANREFANYGEPVNSNGVQLCLQAQNERPGGSMSNLRGSFGRTKRERNVIHARFGRSEVIMSHLSGSFSRTVQGSMLNLSGSSNDLDIGYDSIAAA